ncbi:hypothetical protein CASFOL_022747 [Castilleja foliolosa]|uniref:Uncharacterized protein n=1 Tax=Castilleja foliolosa TaxID=1961234 RepID=A0ABD3CX34_9LAMI
MAAAISFTVPSQEPSSLASRKLKCSFLGASPIRGLCV